jgi:hypothetical protein
MRPALWLLPLLAGCVGVRSLDGERLAVASPAFADYVEQVFRAQNRIAGELAFLLEDSELAAAARAELAEAEARLLAACAPLNRLAIARRDGEDLGRWTELRLARQAPDCEAAAASAERAAVAASE